MRPTATAHAPRPTSLQPSAPSETSANEKRQQRPCANPLDDLPLVDAPPLFGPSALPGGEALDHLDGARLCTTALAGAVSSGSLFASSFALGAMLRTQARHPAATAAGCLLPVLGGALTAPSERALTTLTGLRATEPREPCLGHAAILPGVLWLVHAALRPASPAASACSSLLGTVLGTGMAEAAAQLSHRHDEVGAAADERVRPGTCEVATGRALSLLPYAAYVAWHAWRGTRPPPLAAVGVAAGGWVLRDAFVPANTSKGLP
ncbi:hypothetical protein [Ramlibacter rhizophilus]|uniref:Uncharacterized protein n=1 Tax=Ramlibacter rhizophilus TaxID=1781167 RepID=A0A4Z0BFW9_9BURK|nr:hypothetical protein [Ramlibacter rhizophilus]TFY97353.1 hypothetical protein EZ242_17655 [Ramlibacter rhizophilus]